jgi:hypothetical protein
VLASAVLDQEAVDDDDDRPEMTLEDLDRLS